VKDSGSRSLSDLYLFCQVKDVDIVLMAIVEVAIPVPVFPAHPVQYVINVRVVTGAQAVQAVLRYRMEPLAVMMVNRNVAPIGREVLVVFANGAITEALHATVQSYHIRSITCILSLI